MSLVVKEDKSKMLVPGVQVSANFGHARHKDQSAKSHDNATRDSDPGFGSRKEKKKLL